MKTVAAHAGTWFAGTAIALAGVALARVVAPRLAESAQIAGTIAGQLLALAGLGLLCVGVSRRVWREPPRDEGK
jgi:hypothetical protein